MVESTDMDAVGKSHGGSSICGFWRRIFAFAIDMAVLGMVGIAIGAVLYDFFARLGGWGRGVGFIIALCYFGVCNSSVRNGQTIGKGLLKIRVVDKEFEAISLSKSLLRFTAFGVPYFLNGALISPAVLTNSWATLLLGIIVIFGMAAICYLYVFNRRTRQSLHDLVVGTCVINQASSSDSSVGPAWKGHYAVLGFLFVAVIVVITVVVPRAVKRQPFAELLAVQQALQDSGLVHSSAVSVGKGVLVTPGGKSESSSLTVRAVLRRRPADYNQTIRTVALIVMSTYPKAVEKDSVVVTVMYGYDIGIASSWHDKAEEHTAKQWNDLLFKGGQSLSM